MENILKAAADVKAKSKELLAKSQELLIKAKKDYGHGKRQATVTVTRAGKTFQRKQLVGKKEHLHEKKKDHIQRGKNKAYDIGHGIEVVKLSRDVNGNKTVHIRKPGETRSTAIQTNINLPHTHRLDKDYLKKHGLPENAANEIKAHYHEHMKDKQDKKNNPFGKQAEDKKAEHKEMVGRNEKWNEVNKRIVATQENIDTLKKQLENSTYMGEVVAPSMKEKWNKTLKENEKLLTKLHAEEKAINEGKPSTFEKKMPKHIEETKKQYHHMHDKYQKIKGHRQSMNEMYDADVAKEKAKGNKDFAGREISETQIREDIKRFDAFLAGHPTHGTPTKEAIQEMLTGLQKKKNPSDADKKRITQAEKALSDYDAFKKNQDELAKPRVERHNKRMEHEKHIEKLKGEIRGHQENIHKTLKRKEYRKPNHGGVNLEHPHIKHLAEYGDKLFGGERMSL